MLPYNSYNSSLIQVADLAVTILYGVVTELSSRHPEDASGCSSSASQIWKWISEAQYTTGKLHLNDLHKGESERLRDCASQLDQIMMTQRAQQACQVVSPTLELKVLLLAGSCRFQLDDFGVAKEHLQRLREVHKVNSMPKNHS